MPFSRPPKAIIFDCDGTLVDSETISIRILAEYLNELGWSISVADAIAKYAGQDLHICMSDAEAAIGKPLPSNAIDIFRSRQIPVLKQELQPIVGAEPMLGAIPLPYCIASNAPQEKIKVCLDTTNMRRFFGDDRIFSAYDVQAWKPKPDLFLMAAAKLGFQPHDCIVVEDSIFGIEASFAAGTQTVIYDPHQKFGRFDDQAVRIRSLDQLLPLLGPNAKA